MPGPRLPPGPPTGAATAPAAAYESAPKQRVNLSILAAEHLDQIPGELFTSVSAGFGRFDCDKLLKPSGVELLNLPKTANIEVSIHRRTSPDQLGKQQPQPLYRAYIALAQVKAMTMAGSISGDPSVAPTSEISAVFEDWLGLIGGESLPPSQSNDHLFLHCLEMGRQNSPRPKLLIRLQYVPSGVPLSAAPPRVERPSTQMRSSPQMQTPHPQAFAALTSPGWSPAASTTVTSGSSSEQSTSEALRQRIRVLEKENDELRADRATRDVAEKDVANQVSQLVQQLGIRPTAGTGGAGQQPMAQVSFGLQEVTDKVAALAAQVQDGQSASKSNGLGGSFYRPVISDSVDCLVAATLLRLDCPTAGQLVRLGPGRYQLGELGKRLHCRIDNGRLLTQPEEPLEGGQEDQLPPPVEFSKFISEMFTG